MVEPRTISPPPRDLLLRAEIRFLHPGYATAANQFLSLARVDCENSDGTVIYGLHHKTALIACQIIAGNAFDTGRFTLDRAGLQNVTVSLDGLLKENQYFFIIDGNGSYSTYLNIPVAVGNLFLSRQVPNSVKFSGLEVSS